MLRRWVTFVFAVLILTALLASCSGGSSGAKTIPIVPPTSATATVDFGSSLQTIRGFGGSSAWISDFTPAQANSLFGTSSSRQIGLSLLRVRIDPGGAANWGTELHNAQLATGLGANVIATPWTPPASMKSNNNIVGGSLNTENYGAYASYLESFMTYMQAGNVNLYAISMQNEPDAVVTYESCTWTGMQMGSWVASNASVLTTKLMMPESESFSASYSDPALNDPNAVSHIAIVAGHIYGVTPAVNATAASLNKEVWMTEHYLSGTGIAGALSLAKEVSDSMAVANYSAYLWWWLQNYPSGNYENGLLDENNNITLNGYALGQFSRFIRPGYVRSHATYNPQANVYVTAYHGSGHLVIVALNLGSSDITQSFTVQNQSLTSMTPYQTSASQEIAQQTPVTLSGNAFTATLPAQSITSFVQ